MRDYIDVVSGKLLDLANLVLAGTALGQIGFGKMKPLFSLGAVVFAVILYLVSFYLKKRLKKE